MSKPKTYMDIIREAQTEAWNRGYWQGVADERVIGVADLGRPSELASINPYEEES